MTIQRRRAALAASTASAVLIALTAPVAAHAQVASYSLNIAKQPMASALRAYGQATKQAVAFDAKVVAGKQAPALIGVYTAEEGLRRLVDGSGLVIRRTASGVSYVEAQGPQAEAAPAAGPSALDEVVVTGSRLKNGVTGPKVNVYSAQTIAQSGQVRLETFLNTLPEVSVSAAGNAFVRYGGQAGVRLRGLPDGSTAVLLDGRRTGTSGLNVVSYFDINTIPPALVERMDIVPIGSSAVYGSDAIGGVVNIVLKRRTEGLELNGSYTVAAQHEERGASVLWGKAWDRGSLTMAGSYHEQDGLLGFDREATADSDFRRFASLGGVDRRQPYCAPGTVQARTGLLNGVGATRAAIPTTGADVVANYAAGAGQQNLCSYYAATPLVTPSRRFSVLANGEFEVNDRLTVYATILGSMVRNDLRQNFSALPSQLVPAANPFNPFGQDVLVTTAIPVSAGAILKTQFFRPLVGARGELGNGWDWDISAWAALVHEDDSSGSDSGPGPALAPLLARTDRTTAFNLFNPSANSASLLSQAYVRYKNAAHSEQDVVLGVLRGSPFNMPAGPVRTASGFELRYEDYWKRNTPADVVAFSKGARRTWALFSEAAIPLIGARENEAGRIEATLAGRYDDYSDFGGQFSPQLGLQGWLGDGLRLSTTYSESFRAPALTYLHQKVNTYLNQVGLVDPKRPESYPMTLYIGGNTNLRPETGKARSATADWQSRRFAGLRIALTYWKIGMDDRVGALGYQNIINNEALFPERIVRAPSAGGTPGQIISVNNTYTNFGSIRVSGLDLHANYAWRTDHGVITPSLALTRTLNYRSQLQPNQPFQDRLSRATSADSWAPRYKATAGLAWSQGDTRAQIQGRYVGEYLDHQGSPANTNQLGKDWFVDASLQAPLPFLTGGLAKSAYVRISASNLLNNLPEYSNFSSGLVGYDPFQADIIGRTVTISLGARF